jgi:hypothetical protein
MRKEHRKYAHHVGLTQVGNSGERRVKVTRRWHTLIEYTTAAEVPATLARLAGLEVEQ